MRIAILCADPIYAEGLVSLLRHSGGYEVVCCAGHLGGAHALSNLQPDLLIATEEFDDRTHRFLIQKLKESGMKALLLHGESFQMSAEDPVFDYAMSRYRGVGAMFELIRKAVKGEVDDTPMHEYRGPRKARKSGIEAGVKFTPREREVAELVSRGLSNKQIAAIIGTGEQNVKMYVSRLMRLLGCSNRVQVALLLQPSEAEPAATN